MGKAGIPLTKNDRVRAGSSDSSAGFLIDKLESSDGSVSLELSSCGCTVDLSATSGSAVTTKVTLSYTDFNTASSTITVTPATFTGFAAGTVIKFMKIKHSDSFVGGSVSSATIAVGFGGLSAGGTNVFTTPGNAKGNQLAPTMSGLIMDQVAIDNVDVKLTLVGDTGDNLTGGSVDVWIETQTFS